MDLLIKGMYMPKGDEILRLEILPNGQVNRIIGWAISEKRDAKAIELPPHGRLGDLDALKEEVSDLRLEKKLKNGATQVIELGELFGKFIDDAPTIVEASE